MKFFIKKPSRLADFSTTVLLALTIFGVFWIFSRFTVDDAFITWRYGKNLVEHGIWNYNPAYFDLTQAYTNPIYAILSIVPSYFKIDVVLFFKVFSLLNVIIFATYMIKKTGKIKSILLFFALPATMIHAFSGLETFLYISLLSCLFVSLYEQNFKTSIVLTLILFLTRPESWLLGILVPIYFLLKNLDSDFSKKSLPAILSYENFDFRKCLFSSFIFALFLGLYFAFHKVHFGYALPNTFYVKTGTSFRGFSSLFHYLFLLSFIVVLFFYSKYKLFFLFLLFFLAEIVNYIFSDLKMNYIDRFGFHIFAPIVFILLYTSSKIPVEELSKIISKKISSNYFVNFLTILLIFNYMHFPNNELNEIAVYYPRAIDSHALLGKELNHLKKKENIRSFSFGDAGMAAYHSDMLTLDNIGLGSSLIAQNKGANQEIIKLYSPDIIVTHNHNLKVNGQEELVKYAKKNNYKLLCQISWQPGYYLGLFSPKNYPELKKICQRSIEKNEISNKDYIKNTITFSPWSYWHE